MKPKIDIGTAIKSPEARKIYFTSKRMKKKAARQREQLDQKYE